MMIGGIWGLFNNEPIIPYMYNSFTQFNQDILQFITRFIGIGFLIGGVILFYYISKLPSDSMANSIANDTKTIKKSIINLNQLYGLLINKAMTYNTNGYLPFIENDIVFQKDLKKYMDKSVAIRSYIAYNPQNPLIEHLKKESKEWNTLNNNIDRTAMSMSDNKLLMLLRSYRDQLDTSGLYKLRAKITLVENPVTNYANRQIGNFNQDTLEINLETARTNLINYLNELISEYDE